MKKLLVTIMALIFIPAMARAAVAAPVNEEDTMQTDNEVVKIEGAKGAAGSDISGNTMMATGKKVFTKFGALEKKEGDKYILRRKSGEIEFYLNENTKVYIKEQADPAKIEKGNYICVKGPKNKQAILGSTIYVFKDKKVFDEYVDKAFKDDDEIKRFDIFSKGTVDATQEIFDKVDAGLKPFVLALDDKTKALLSYDEDAFWVMISKGDATSLGLGERISLYFNTIVSIRIKNYPIRIIVNKTKAGL